MSRRPDKALVVNFGQWDEWVPLFETVRRNGSIEFLVFTDCNMEGLTAPVTLMSFAEYVWHGTGSL